MSEENVEVVRTALTALDQRDVELYLSVASPEIELVTPAAPLEGPNIGHEGVRGFFSEMETFAESSRFEVEEIRAVGPRVLAFFTVSGVGRISRIDTSVEVAAVYSFEGGKIRRAQIFTDRAEALEAAGLRE
jgi:ketosteroid isomerase-like protein